MNQKNYFEKSFLKTVLARALFQEKLIITHENYHPVNDDCCPLGGEYVPCRILPSTKSKQIQQQSLKKKHDSRIFIEVLIPGF